MASRSALCALGVPLLARRLVAPAQLAGARIPGGEILHRLAGGGRERQGVGIALGPRDDLVEAVMHRSDQRIKTLPARQQVVLDIGVARHHPDVTQYFVEHFGRAARASAAAERAQHRP